MINKEEVKVGDKVYYQPFYYLKDDKWENGIVKEVPEHSVSSVRVVYNCNNDWDNYKNYTSAMTDVRDLNKGWK